MMGEARISFPTGPNEIERLKALLELSLHAGEPDPALDAICQTARERFDVPIALVTLLYHERQLLRGRSGTDGTETPRSLAFCNHTILADEIFVVLDATADPRFADNPLVTGEPHIRFYAGAPLTYLHGIRFGALCLIDRKPRRFSLGDRAELAELADTVVSAVAAGQFRDLLSIRPSG